MTRTGLILAYLFFFFMYFFGFGWLGNINSGFPYNWEKQFTPFDISMYIYTLLTVLLAHFLVFRRYYYAKPHWKLWVALFALLIFFILFRYLLEEIIYPRLIGKGNYNPSTTFRYYIFDNVYFGSVKIFIGFVLFLFDELFRQHRQKVDLLQQNKKAELSFLQAQMNPHFLFNSLNNIYSLASEQHPKTATSVLKLSDMMRYVTYEKDKQTELSKEVEYVYNLLDIQQLRHDYKLNFEFTIAPDALTCRVMPLLLIPLIENALKHGDLSDASQPLKMILQVKQKKLEILVSNKITLQHSPIKGGVGLKNLKRRLELTFRPDEYIFTAEQKENIFIVNITIPFF
jgi:two-component system, LytTR family, sensor kinase